MCNDHDYCYVELPNEDNKILKYNNKLYTKKKNTCTHLRLFIV